MLKLACFSYFIILIQFVFLSDNFINDSNKTSCKRKVSEIFNYCENKGKNQLSTTGEKTSPDIELSDITQKIFKKDSYTEMKSVIKKQNQSNIQKNHDYKEHDKNLDSKLQKDLTSSTLYDTQDSNCMQMNSTSHLIDFEPRQFYHLNELYPYQIITEKTEILNQNELCQEASSSGHSSANSYIQMKNQCNLSITENISLQENILASDPTDYVSSDKKSIENNKNLDFTEEMEKFYSQQQYYYRRSKNKIISNRIRRKNVSSNQITFMSENLQFIRDISSSFFMQQNQSSKTDLQISCVNLKLCLLDKINIANSELNEDLTKQNKTFLFRKNPNISELVHLCPFCKLNELTSENFENIENKLIAEFQPGFIQSEVCSLIENLFKEISNSFKNPFTPQDLFSSEFYLSQRIILEKIINIVNSNKLRFDLENRRKYLHVEYHKLFLENIDMKIYFLPEIQSILYLLFKSSINDRLILKNYNFMIGFYCFHSMNRFFDWIQEFYEKNRVLVDESQTPLSKFTFQTISFILRICFIEPMNSLFIVQRSTQLRFHLLSLNIYYDELLRFLDETNHRDVIASNSRILLPIIILIEKYMTQKSFDYYLEFEMDKLIMMNSNNIKKFIRVLEFLNKTTNLHLNEQSQILETFLRSFFLSNK